MSRLGKIENTKANLQDAHNTNIEIELTLPESVGEKRKKQEVSIPLKQSKLEAQIAPYKVAILDIEGTTTSISFVADVLFPWIRKNLASHLTATFSSDHTQEVFKGLQIENQQDLMSDSTTPRMDAKKVDSVLEYIIWLMDRDRKSTPLKKLQGKMFERAYQTGEIKGHLYDDVFPAFKEWKRQGVSIYIYSSGSVQAQKLLFQYSECGDLLTDFIRGHFDTVFPGSKLISESYVKIASNVLSQTKRIDMIFVTDNVKEAEAANEIGLRVYVACRGEPVETRFPTIRTFDELF